MLTGRQQEIWEFLAEYVGKHGYPPTVREIGESVGLASPSTVHAHLANLERAGYLRRDPTKPRALELLRDRPVAAGAPEVHKLPLLGSSPRARRSSPRSTSTSTSPCPNRSPVVAKSSCSASGGTR